MTSNGIRRRVYSKSDEETSIDLESSVKCLPGEHGRASYLLGPSEESLLQFTKRSADMDHKTGSSQYDCGGRIRWLCVISNVIVECTKCLEIFLVRAVSLTGRLFPLTLLTRRRHKSKNFQLYYGILQVERLRNLKRRFKTTYDNSQLDHQNVLRKLWELAFPGRELTSLNSELWKEMGWQGTDPSTDFRAGGLMSLENLIFFAEHYPYSFQKVLHKKNGKRSEWEYPFAIAGVNISFMLNQMLDLQSKTPTSRFGAIFMELLGENEMAFEILYCVAFMILDEQWISRYASYMEFNEVLMLTRRQLERELSLKTVTKIEDLPSYRLLGK